jgi:hypothetical protein
MNTVTTAQGTGFRFLSASSNFTFFSFFTKNYRRETRFYELTPIQPNVGTVVDRLIGLITFIFFREKDVIIYKIIEQFTNRTVQRK